MTMLVGGAPMGAIDLRDETLSVPGKTFLLGEYLALEGGPSLLITTEPRFRLRVSRRRNSKPVGIQSASPAAKLLAKHAARSIDWHLEFEDPHGGLGGLGASSAQFALTYAWLNALSASDIESGIEWRMMLEEYRMHAWSGEGHAPSGADVVAQLVGGLCFFDGRNGTARQMTWPFRNLTFTLVRTGIKLATHEHLRETKAIPTDALRACMRSACEALETANENDLLISINRYADLLEEADLTAKATVGLLRALKAQLPDAVRAAKGCGAMGADVILVLHDRDRSAEISAWLASKSLEICGGTAGFSTGETGLARELTVAQ